jgi:hypothetical protein
MLWVLQGDRRLEEQLATLLESRMEMDAEWSAAQAQAMQPQVCVPPYKIVLHLAVVACQGMFSGHKTHESCAVSHVL